MYKVNEIQKRINSKRKLAADLLKLAEGLRVKNNYADLPRVEVGTLDEGYVFLDCGNTVCRSARMSWYILASEDLRGFLEANQRYQPKAEQYFRRVGKSGGQAVSCVRIVFTFQGEGSRIQDSGAREGRRRNEDQSCCKAAEEREGAERAGGPYR